MKIQFSTPIASITVDCVIFGFKNEKLHLLNIVRSSEPSAGQWALPGGFMEIDETLEEAANRVLESLTGLKGIFMEQIQIFSEVKRHPTDRVVTVAYCALINSKQFSLKAAQHASKVTWHEINSIPPLAFDHSKLVQAGLNHLRREVKLRPIGFELLPKKFTLTDLQNLYEEILNKKLDKRNFRRKLKNLGFLKELEEKKKGAHLYANLYSFDKKSYDQLNIDGFLFNI